jgi:tetratricopeptide (TPR) repeat protein
MAGLRDALESAGLPTIYHSTEQGFSSCHAEDVVERISREGSKQLGGLGVKFRRVPQQTQHDNEPALPRFEFKGGPLYVLLDGLDFIVDDNGFGVSYVPVDLPPCMRLVLSVSHGPLLDSLAARRYRVHEMAPLSPEGKSELILAHAIRRGSQDEVMQGLLAWPPGGHPTHLLFAAKLAELTGRAPAENEDVPTVLNRLIEAMGSSIPNLAVLAHCKYGLPAKRPLDSLRMSVARPLIVERGNFFQPAMSEVQQLLRRKYGEGELRRGRLELANGLAECPFGAAIDEAAQHFVELDEKERLADLLTSFMTFTMLIHRSSGRFSYYWNKAGAKDAIGRFERMYESQAEGLEARGRVALLCNIGLMLSGCDAPEVAERFYRRSIDEARTSDVPQPGNLATAYFNLAVLISRKPDRYAEAEQVYLELLAMVDGVAEDSPVTKWRVLENYAGLLENMFRKEESLARREEGVVAAREKLGAGHPAVGELLLGLSSNVRWWKPDRALACAEQGHAILAAAAGPRHGKAIWGLGEMARSQLMLGRYEQARAIYEQTLEIAKEEEKSSPHAIASALENLADAAEEAGDRPRGLGYRKKKLEHQQSRLGPGHLNTLYAAKSLASCYEKNGQLERALELMEECLRDCSALGKEANSCATDATVQLARMRLFARNRDGCARLVDELEKRAPGELSNGLKTEVLLLKSELASVDGYTDDSRRLVAEACALHPMNYADLPSQFGVVRTVRAGLLHLAGDAEASLREHEAGVQQTLFGQRHMLDFTLRPYETSLRHHGGQDDLARARIAELRLMLNTHVDSFGLAQIPLPPRPVRVAWNPKSPSILALLDGNGRSCLFEWHDSAGMIEQLEAPFAAVEMPADPALVSLNWSSSGEALRLLTPQGQAVNGSANGNEEWSPASAISPNRAYIAVMRRQSLRIVRALAT